MFRGKTSFFPLSKKLGKVAAVASANLKTTSTALPVVKLDLVRNKIKVSKKALLDSGSQKTFIKNTVATELGLKPVGKVNLTVEGFLVDSGNQEYDVVNLTVKLGRSYHRIQALVTDRLPQQLQVLGMTKVTKYLKDKIRLVDPNINSDQFSDLGLLIGMDYFFKIVKGVSKYNNIDLFTTNAGYIIGGKIPAVYAPENVTSQQVILVTNVNVIDYNQPDELADEISNLWRLETVGIAEHVNTPEERYAQKEFDNTVRYQGGKYWVRLPWKQNHPPLPNNYKLCLARTRYTHHKLKSTPEQLDKFGQILSNQLESGFIEEVPNAVVSSNTHYLPQLTVSKDSKTTPIRIVYDCSAKSNSKSISLNDCLYTGPSLVEDLPKVLLKFRLNKWAFSADISKAFLRIGLQEVDRDYTRFIWPKEPFRFEEPLITYRFKSVLFGSTSSPFLLQATLNYHLAHNYPDNKYAEIIRESLYVDNLQGVVSDEQTLLEIYRQINYILNQASMPLQEWCSNSEALNQIIKLDYPTETVDLTVKVLGLCWNRVTDYLSSKPVTWTKVTTKRHLMSNCGKIYDPLGLICPVTVQFRQIMQQAWSLHLEWDENLPVSIVKQWDSLVKQTQGIETLCYPRMVCEREENCELHVFSDASPKSYGAVSYIMKKGENPKILMAKARVAPLKPKTLPQLELTAVLIASKLAKYINDTLEIQITETHIWSDSEIAIQWILNGKSKIVYVRNRVAQIKETTPHAIIHYINTKDNPADYITRGMSVEKLRGNKLWLQGPEWINNRNLWPEQKFEQILTCPVVDTHLEPLIECSRYSTLSKLLRVTKTVFAAANKFRRDTVEEVSELKFLIRMIQKTELPLEYEYLVTKKGTIPDKVKSLRLFLKEGIIRSSGRIENAELPFETKNPILLPKKHALTTLIIERCHSAVLHGGVGETLCKVREKFWVPQARQIIKTILNRCYVCKRLEGHRFPLPPSPPLPIERVTNSIPFEITGVDYTGAITLKTGDYNSKVYVCLFTCANTRAIHLELAEDLSAETFLILFRRFVARRSCPKIMISDNATNFRASSEVLCKLSQDPLIKRHFEDYNIIWKFIPPRSPWYGGFYERLIGIVKGCLRKVLFQRKINLPELHTLLVEIEARVNNRPLTYQTDSQSQLEPLTPAHLLYGHKIDLFPIHLEGAPTTESFTHDSLNKKQKCLNRVLDKWQKTWKNDYLTSLRERKPPRGQNSPFKQKIKVGDVVIIHSEGNREDWPLGKIIEVYPDDKGDIRVVKLQSRMGIIIRTINLLYPLEEAVEPPDTNSTDINGETDIEDEESNPETISTEESDEDSVQNQTQVPDAQQGPLPDQNQVGTVPRAPFSPNNPSQGGTARLRRQAAQRCRNWLRRVCTDM